MCHYNDDCEATDQHWEGEEHISGGASIAPFGCDGCGYSNCL